MIDQRVRVLLVKTSSLGDVVHLLPALTDAKLAHPELCFDWVVERGYAALPRMHPGVAQVHTVALRSWRHALLKTATWRDISQSRRELRRQHYDYIIDAQGLFKSALLCKLLQGNSWGFDKLSAREPYASVLYQHRIQVPWSEHAIQRCRRLLSAVLDYPLPGAGPAYGICAPQQPTVTNRQYGRYVLGLHGTSRAAKEWPEAHWRALATQLRAAGAQLLLPWGSERERQRAERISENRIATVLPALDYQALAQIIDGADAIVGVDTGLLHLAAALRKPVIALYPSTDPARTGAMADRESPYPVLNFTGPDALAVSNVWRSLVSILECEQRDKADSVSA